MSGNGYTPVFNTVFDGSLYGKWPDSAVWLTMLALCDSRGNVDMSYQAIAGRTGWPMDLLRQGITGLMEPDVQSRSPAEEGRRLVPLDPARGWGWHLVNHSLYREKARLQAKDAARTASGVDAFRKRAERVLSPEVPRTPPPSPEVPLSDSDTNSDTNAKKMDGGKRAARAQTAQRLSEAFELTEGRKAIARAEAVNPEREFARFCDHWRAASGASARKHDWDAAWRNWCRKAAEFAPRGGAKSEAPALTWRPPPDDEGSDVPA